MDINLTDSSKRVIESWIAVGKFHSADEVIEAAVQQFGAANDPTLDSLREKIMVGLREHEAGLGREIDFEQFYDECRRRRDAQQSDR